MFKKAQADKFDKNEFFQAVMSELIECTYSKIIWT